MSRYGWWPSRRGVVLARDTILATTLVSVPVIVVIAALLA